MTGKITYFKTKDFDKRGIFNEFHSECRLGDAFFRKGDTFKHQEILQALNTCKKHNGFGVNTLIVNDESDLTIWIEDTSQSQAASAINPQAPLPTKTVTKRYRGQVYEETVVDWAAVATQKQGVKTEKSRRKYRGNYID